MVARKVTPPSFYRVPFLLVCPTLRFILTPFITVTEIWDALRAAAEADPTLAQVIVESAGIILQNPDMTVCFDERGSSNWVCSSHISLLVIKIAADVCRSKI